MAAFFYARAPGRSEIHHPRDEVHPMALTKDMTRVGPMRAPRLRWACGLPSACLLLGSPAGFTVGCSATHAGDDIQNEPAGAADGGGHAAVGTGVPSDLGDATTGSIAPGDVSPPSEGGSAPASAADAGAEAYPPASPDSGATAPSSVDAAQSSDGPSNDAGPPGRDAATRSSMCSSLFCEDFERGTLDPAVWTTQVNGGQTVGVVETALAAHGKFAVQFHANPNVQSYDFIIAKNAPVALQAHHFGRAYFYVTPKPPAEHTGFLFAGTSGFPNLKYLEVAGIGAAWQLTFVNLLPGGGESYASGGNAPVARWVCLEWEFNDAPDQATVFVDGQPSFSRTSITFNGSSTGLVGGFADVGFGYYAWHPASYPFDVYYDDIALDVKRIGCLP
jgi:hypothetical protein